MNPPEFPADGRTPPSSPKKELQLHGQHPTPLKVSQESHKIKKPPMSPSAAATPGTTQQQRKPRIIYDNPKVITVRTPSDFKKLVQRLTGLPPGKEPATVTGDVPAAAVQTSPSEKERVVKSKSREESVTWHNVPVMPMPAILSPATAPVTLTQPSPSDFLSDSMVPPQSSPNLFNPVQSHAAIQWSNDPLLPMPASAPNTLPPIEPRTFSPMTETVSFGNDFSEANSFWARPPGLLPRMLSPARATLPPISPGSFSPMIEPASFSNDFWSSNRFSETPSGLFPRISPPAQATVLPIAPGSSSPMTEPMSFGDFFFSVNGLLTSPSGLPPGILSPATAPLTPPQPSPSDLLSDSIFPPEPSSPNLFNPFD